MVKNILAGSVLPALLLLLVNSRVQAEPIAFSCSVSQGFNLRDSSEAIVGHVTDMTIGSQELGTDLGVTDPEDLKGDRLNVSAVISDIYWGGEYADPISITARVSTANKDTLVELLDSDVPDTRVQFGFNIFDYDDDQQKYYIGFSPLPRTLSGVLAKRGGEVLLNVDSDPAQEVPVPRNYEFTIEIMPDEHIAQDLEIAFGVSDKIVKRWGPYVPVPEPSTFMLAALGMLGLAFLRSRPTGSGPSPR